MTSSQFKIDFNSRRWWCLQGKGEFKVRFNSERSGVERSGNFTLKRSRARIVKLGSGAERKANKFSLIFNDIKVFIQTILNIFWNFSFV